MEAEDNFLYVISKQIFKKLRANYVKRKCLTNMALL